MSNPKAIHAGTRKRMVYRISAWLLRHYFAGIHVRGNLPQLTQSNEPHLYYANHVTPWDYTVGSYITYCLAHQDPFCMAAEYTALPLVHWAGVFTVDPSNLLNAAKSLQYSVALLKTVYRCGLWIFPQGAVMPQDHRPLLFQPGIGYIVSHVDHVQVVPVAISYAFSNQTRPEMFLHFGDPFNVAPYTQSASILTREFEAKLIQSLDVLHDDLAAGTVSEFITILDGSGDIRSLARQVLMRKPSAPLKRWGMWYRNKQ